MKYFAYKCLPESNANQPDSFVLEALRVDKYNTCCSRLDLKRNSFPYMARSVVYSLKQNFMNNFNFLKWF